MKTIRVLSLIGLGLVWSLQVWAVPSFPIGGGELGPTSDQPADTVINDAAQANGLSVVSPGQVPVLGTFWVFAESGNQPAPLPCPPGDASLPIFAIADGQFLVGDNADPAGASADLLTAQAGAVVALIAQVQSVPSSHPMFRAMAELPPSPGGGSGDGDGVVTNSDGIPLNTNELWLTITNVANGLADLNLYVPTNEIYAASQVYAIWETTNLTTGWEVADEVWLPTPLPTTNPVAIPFTLPTLGQSTLFVRAEDWTGVTENGNTTPDWWFWEYFGTTDLADTNLDSGGINTLSYDYAHDLDPNVIQFTGIEVTNNYVNNVTVPGQLDLSGGVPAYIAVSLDDTNFATDANWQAYFGTNLNITLPMTPGWHQVWVGLKGPAANATITWQAKQLQLNFNPPLLVFTNPATILSTSSVPLVQVAGFCPEPLGSLSYDLSNALGLVTNQNAGVTSQYYDTNTWSFTTNYFECVDVPLTNGLNIITLHVTDLAGNVTTTNLSVILDYSSRTNPPVVNLFWPQNGTLICNTNFTWRGWVDDPTATVSAQLVDTNGDTNVFSGLVERDGDFWVEDLPLTNGANYLTLTVTDSAGNVTVTNITVYPGAVGLTITMPDDSQLWNQGLTVSGTISDQDDYTVWVNGVQATYDDDGLSWTATNVFLPDGGTALIQARAIPNTDNGGLGTGGSGGGPVTYDNLGNPDPPQDNDAEIQANKPMLLYQKSYYRRLTSTITDNELLSDQGGSSECTLNETTGAGGTNTVIENTYISDTFDSYFLETSYQATTTWPSNGVPIITSTVTFNEDPWGSTTNTTSVTNNVPGSSPPSYANEHCAINACLTHANFSAYGGVFGDVYPWSDSELWGKNGVVTPYTRNADTVLELKTGGKGIFLSQNLFCLSASASEITDKLVFGIDVNTPAIGISPTKIQVDGKPLGSDGNIYKVYSNNDTRNVTPDVKGKDFYSFFISAGKHILTSYTWCPALTDTNRLRTTVGVGEQVEVYFDPPLAMTFPEEPWWFTSAGGISPDLGSEITFTAASNACSANITVEVRDIAINKNFDIVNPSGVSAKINTTTGSLIPVGSVGAWMHLNVTMQPTDVSFYRVNVFELGVNATDTNGYFVLSPPLNHGTGQGGNIWHTVASNNLIGDQTIGQQVDTCYYNLPGFDFSQGGSFTWPISAFWVIDQSNPAALKSLPWSPQVFNLDAFGTMTISKFGSQVSRTVFNDISPTLP